MGSLTYNIPNCQEDEIPFDTGPIYRQAHIEPSATPLADIWIDGGDAAGMDAEIMSIGEWLEHVLAYELEPEIAFFEDVPEAGYGWGG